MMAASRTLAALWLALCLTCLTCSASAQESRPASGEFPAGPAVAEPATLVFKPLAVGEKRTQKGSMNLDMQIQVAGEQQMTQAMTKSFERTLALTGVEGQQVTLAQVGFTKQRETMEGTGPAGQPIKQERGQELEGKRFELARKGGATLYFDLEGKSIEDYATKRELEQAGRSLFEAPIGAKLAELGELTPGRRVQIAPEGMKVLLEMPADDGLEVKFEEFTYRGTRQVPGAKAAVFKVVLNLEPGENTPREGPGMKLRLGGEILVALETGRVVGLEMAGKLVFLQPAQGPAFEGEGVLRLERSTRVEFP